MTETFAYNSIPEDMVVIILDIYQQVQSYLKVSLHPDIACSTSTIARVVDAAISQGVLDQNIRQTGRPKVNRNRVLSLIDEFPWATIAEIAQLAECSPATIYRIKSGE